jgi:hypothetical protein
MSGGYTNPEKQISEGSEQRPVCDEQNCQSDSASGGYKNPEKKMSEGSEQRPVCDEQNCQSVSASASEDTEVSLPLLHVAQLQEIILSTTSFIYLFIHVCTN